MLFGGVYGTVLTSALLGALQRQGSCYTPVYDASWILLTVLAAALAHAYAHHMSARDQASGTDRWRRLVRAGATEWPVVVACLPTVLLLVAAGFAHWPEKPATVAGLVANAVALFLWGVFAAQRAGYRRKTVLLIGACDAAVGLLIVAANAVIK